MKADQSIFPLLLVIDGVIWLHVATAVLVSL